MKILRRFKPSDIEQLGTMLGQTTVGLGVGDIVRRKPFYASPVWFGKIVGLGKDKEPDGWPYITAIIEYIYGKGLGSYSFNVLLPISLNESRFIYFKTGLNVLRNGLHIRPQHYKVDEYAHDKQFREINNVGSNRDYIISRLLFDSRDNDQKIKDIISKYQDFIMPIGIHY